MIETNTTETPADEEDRSILHRIAEKSPTAMIRKALVAAFRDEDEEPTDEELDSAREAADNPHRFEGFGGE